MDLGHYRVERQLADGLLGPVYACVDADGARVAVRLLRPELTRSSATLPLLQKLCQELTPPPLARILPALRCEQRPDGTLLWVTPLLEAEDARTWVQRQGARRMLHVLTIGREAARLLTAAHARQLWHLALRPSQLLVDTTAGLRGELQVYLLDLGLSKALGLERVSALPPRARLPYAAPEQQDAGSQPDGRADVFALGCVLAELTLGTAPELARPPDELAKQLSERGLPRSVVDVVLGMLVPSPGQRPPMAAVAATLKAAVESVESEDSELLRATSRLVSPSAAAKEAASAAEPQPQQALAAAVTEPIPAPGADPNLGKLFGNFRLLRKLGEGGMGVVYEAEHHKIGRRAAVKILHREIAQNAEYAQRFLNEARAVNIVRHPGLVEIFEYGQRSDGTLFIVMEFLEGQSLYDRTHERSSKGQRTLEAGAVAQLALQVARALAAAHAKGIVHRDLKPENIMLVPDPTRPGEERIKILDFGIAKVARRQRPVGALSRSTDLGASAEQTRVGAFMGTPMYMAPEQHGSAEEADGRADVFALGVVLYELLTGRLPYPGNSLSVLRTPAEPVERHSPGTPAPLSALLQRMLAGEPENRPTMAEVAQALAPYGRLSSEALPHGPRKRVLYLALLVGAVSAIVLGGILLLLLRAPVVSTLAEARERALTEVRAGLAATAPEVQAHALAALGQSRDPTYRGLAEPLLLHRSPSVAAAAARALGQMGSTEAGTALLALLGRTQDPHLRLEVGDALGRLHHPRGLPTLRGLADDADELTRITATLRLLDYGEPGEPARAERLRRAADRPGLRDTVGVTILTGLARAGDEAARQSLSERLAAARPGEPGLPLVAFALARLGDGAARQRLSELAAQPGSERVLAARLLASLGESAPCPVLGQLALDRRLGDAARATALDGAGDCGQAEAASSLAPILDERGASPRLRLAAAGAILQLAASDQLADQALNWARAALRADSQSSRELAVAVLGELDAEAAVSPLRLALKDREREVRRAAAQALGKKQARAALEALLDALADSDAEVRAAGVQSIGQVASALRRRGEAGADGDAVSRLRQLAAGTDEVDRVMAAGALAQLGETAQRAAVRASLASTSPLVRRLAVEMMEQDEALLGRALKDPDRRVRLLAARRLAALGSRLGVAALRELADGGGPEALQAFAVLRQLGDEAARLPDLLGLIQQGGTAERAAVLDLLGELDVRAALRPLQVLANDASPLLRRRALEVAAALYRRSRQLELLHVVQALKNDPDLVVRARAAALRELPAPVAGEPSGGREASGQPGDKDKGPPPADSGSLLLVGEEGVRVQIDRRPGFTVSDKPVPLPPGKHRVCALTVCQDAAVTAGETATVRIAATLAEQLLGDADAALRDKDAGRAMGHLERARRLLLRGAARPTLHGDLQVLLGRAYELRSQWREAMAEYGKFQRLPPPQRSAPATAQVKAAIARLAPRMGRIQIYTLQGGRCQLTDEYYLPPGEHLISLGGGRQRTVQLDAGVTTPVRQCQ